MSSESGFAPRQDRCGAFVGSPGAARQQLRLPIKGRSDRDGERVVDLDAQVAHGALELGVPEQQLHCPQVAGAAVDQRRLRPSERLGAVGGSIHSDGVQPDADQPGAAGWSAASPVPTVGKEVVARPPPSRLDPGGHGSPGLLGQLGLHRMAGLPLPDDRPRLDLAADGDVVDLEVDEVVAAQLAVVARSNSARSRTTPVCCR